MDIDIYETKKKKKKVKGKEKILLDAKERSGYLYTTRKFSSQIQ